MAVDTYKCPNCGAPLAYTPSSSNVKCEYCLSEFSPEEIISFNEGQSQAPSATQGYHCDNCGAEVITDETTSSSFCYYCHSPVILTDRVSGDFTPDSIVPFSIDKKSAQERFKKWAKSYRLVPKSFYSESQLEKITGIYLPYWLVDSKADLDIEATGDRVSKSTIGSQEKTTIETYKIVRDGEVSLDDFKKLASNKIEPELIGSVESKLSNKRKKFSTIYLSGFFSQRYDQTKEDLEPEVKQKLGAYYQQYVDNTFAPYSNVKVEKKEWKYTIRGWEYVLIPYWILTYDFRNKRYVYALNGETGKFFGELPIDKRKYYLENIGIGLIVLVLLLLGGLFIW